jgi:hypothetical protein
LLPGLEKQYWGEDSITKSVFVLGDRYFLDLLFLSLFLRTDMWSGELLVEFSGELILG